MCIGVPMRVLATDAGMAFCEGRGRRERLNTMLIGETPAGSWVLAHRGSAIRALTAEQAAQTNAALDSLDAALAGERDLDAHFADLAHREPELPAHLKGQRQ